MKANMYQALAIGQELLRLRTTHILTYLILTLFYGCRHSGINSLAQDHVVQAPKQAV